MNKGLEALKELKYVHDTECGEDKSVNERFTLIETELKRLEELETRFATLKTNYNMVNDLCKQYCDECVKQRKILRIIEEKRVDFGILPYCLDLETYNNAIVVNGNEWTNYKPLTQEEFDLLKEWLE